MRLAADWTPSDTCHLFGDDNHDSLHCRACWGLETSGACGHDYGDDPHDAPNDKVVCSDCCKSPGCAPSSAPPACGADAATGVPDAPAPVGSAQDAAPVAAPLADKE